MLDSLCGEDGRVGSQTLEAADWAFVPTYRSVPQGQDGFESLDRPLLRTVGHIVMVGIARSRKLDDKTRWGTARILVNRAQEGFGTQQHRRAVGQRER